MAVMGCGVAVAGVEPGCGSLLLVDGRLGRFGQCAAGGLVQHQGRHQHLEHRARPGFEAGHPSARKEGPAQRPPVPGRDVALGNGEQAGQARLRGQQVVVRGVQPLAFNLQADVQQPALGVVQKAELVAQRQRAQATSQAVQVGPGRGVGQRAQRRPSLGTRL